MSPPIVLIHGLWLTPRSWEGWKARFEQRGHEVHVPAWPRMEREVEALRGDPSVLNGLGNDQDHTIPASVSKEAAKRLGKSKAVVDYKEFAGRPHFTAGAPGWEAVADYALDWANRHVGAPTQTLEPARV